MISLWYNDNDQPYTLSIMSCIGRSHTIICSKVELKAYKNERIKRKEQQMVEKPTTKLKKHNPNELVSFDITPTLRE
jgi:hypothetical protein